MTDTLDAYIRSYLEDEEVGLWPADPARENHLNTWSYGIPEVPVDVPAVIAALGDVQQELRQRFGGDESGGTFYAWYDQLAGQLRCSLTSLAPGELPFRGGYRATYEAGEIVELVAADTTRGVVALSELEEDAGSELPPRKDAEPPLLVWVSPVGKWMSQPE